MKNKIYYLIICLVLTFTSCTDHFDEIDTDKAGITNTPEGEGELKQPAIEYLSQAQRLIYNDDTGPYPIAAWVLQLQTNLNVDIWAGYLASGTLFIGGKNNQSYKLVDGWNGYMLQYWNMTMSQIDEMRISYEQVADKTPEDHTIRAISLLTKVLASERTADMYGTLPYLSFGSSKPAYDNLDVVYSTFFSEIDQAKELLSKGSNLSKDQGKDLFYGGNVDKWNKLANTLRLRLAMRIVKADPDESKKQAEKALLDAAGLISDNSENCGFTKGYKNGLCVLAQAWGDTRMSADMESILCGYDDPRLPKYFSTVDGKYRGIRVGSDFKGNMGPSFSSLGTAFPRDASYDIAPIFLVTSAEAYFLKAEAALRGFAGSGSASDSYNLGIEHSLKQWGVNDEALITAYKKSKLKPRDWTSIDESIANSVPAASKVTPSFDDATDNEAKLEKIITQKWIAMFPGGSTVAWSEYRRTGYPRMLMPFKTYSSPVVNVSYGPKVVNNAKKAAIPSSQYQDNYEFVIQAVEDYFGNKDDITTPVWWDVDVPNI